MFLIEYCFCCILLTIQGYFRMCWSVMLTTLSCFLEYQILVKGHLWQHHWMISDWWCSWDILVNPSKMRGMLISQSRTVEPLFPDFIVDGTVDEMVSELKIFGVILDSKLAFEKHVRKIAASASMRVWYFEEENECFSRCCCCCQMLLGIRSPCARVLFSSLDVCSHFPPIVTQSCCWPS